MIKSMTGFGQGSFEGADFKVIFDIRAVNNRHLDLYLRLPPELTALEVPIRRRIQDALKRGRIDITVTVTQTEVIKYEINRPLIRGYLTALEMMRDEFGLGGELDINSIARLPGAIQASTETTNLSQELIDGVNSALDQALAALTEMRSVEGLALAGELSSRCRIIESQLPVIEQKAGTFVDAYRERLLKRIKEIVGDAFSIDESRLAQEAAYLAERSDISEELARLRSHVAQFQELIEAGGEVGKKLDFILQEMNREANTILSKSNDREIVDAAIIIKTEVEKLREQVQNVE